MRAAARSGRWRCWSCWRPAPATSRQSPQPPLLRLTRSAFADLPGWNDSDADAALAAFQRGCAVLTPKPDAAPMGGAGYAGTVADWRARLRRGAGRCARLFRKEFHALCGRRRRRCSPAITSRKSAAAARAAALSRRRSMACPPIWCGPIWACSIPSCRASIFPAGWTAIAWCPMPTAPRSMPRRRRRAGAVLYRRSGRLFLPADPGLGPGAVR